MSKKTRFFYIYESPRGFKNEYYLYAVPEMLFGQFWKFILKNFDCNRKIFQASYREARDLLAERSNPLETLYREVSVICDSKDSICVPKLFEGRDDSIAVELFDPKKGSLDVVGFC